MPQEAIPARAVRATATSENAPQLIARGFVALGLLEVRALGYAAMSGKTAAVERLLDAKAPVNQGYIHPAGINTTAPHEAVHGGNPQLVELLIARGADVNAIPSFGYPALNDAVASENTEVVRILMAHGANPRLKGFNGTSAKDEAAKIPDPRRERILRMLGTANRN